MLDAWWVRTAAPHTFDDQKFLSAIQELTAYAFDEASRMKAKKLDGPKGILEEVQLLLTKYRGELVKQSHLLALAEGGEARRRGR